MCGCVMRRCASGQTDRQRDGQRDTLVTTAAVYCADAYFGISARNSRRPVTGDAVVDADETEAAVLAAEPCRDGVLALATGAQARVLTTVHVQSQTEREAATS